MKNGILYGGPFLFAFILVTGAIIYLNSNYENIFTFNFNPKTNINFNSDSSKTKFPKKNEIKKTNQNKPIEKNPVLTSSLQTEKQVKKIEEPKDTLKKQETNLEAEIQDSIGSDLTAEKNDVSESSENTIGVEEKLEKEEEYSEWLKKVTAIYESLEPGKAAKIIQTYSDNVARDILYNMRKKNAAKIVAELSPETTNRIFRFE